MKLKVEKEKEDMEKNETVATKISDEQILDFLFKQVEKPKNYFKIKVVNVFGTRYRINVWSKIEEEELTKCKITHSYFIRVIDDILTVY